MWKSPLSLVLLVVTLSCVIGFSGCAAIDRAFTVPAPPVHQTVTNELGQVFDATYTPVALSPAVAPYVDAGKDVVSVLPSPAREIGGGVLAVLLGAAGTYVRTRNKIKASQAIADANAATLESVILGVEKSASAEVKQAITKQAQADGTQSNLHVAVKNVT